MKYFFYVMISILAVCTTVNNTLAKEHESLRKITTNTAGKDVIQFAILSEEDKTVELSQYTSYKGAKNLETFDIPAEITYKDVTYSVISIGSGFDVYYYEYNSFGELYKCSAPIKTLSIPNSVKYIKEKAFQYDFSFDLESEIYISEINLPPTLLDIEESAFEQYRDWGGKSYVHAYLEKPLIISNYIEEIKKFTFFNIDFDQVTIGRNVKTIYDSAFGTDNDYYPIDILYCCATTPPNIDKNNLTYNYNNVVGSQTKLLVPPGCKEAYENDENWCRAKSIEEYEYYVDAEFKEGDSGKMLINRALKLNPVITWLHDGSSERYRVWKSSDESVATVSQAGVIVSRNYGTATITLTIEDERGVPFDCTFKVEVTDEAGVTDILELNDADTTVEVFMLNGVKVGDTTDNLPAGFYIIKSAKETKKICIK